MSVSLTTVRVQYTGDGNTVKFALPVAFFKDPNDTTQALIDAGGDINVYFGAPGVLQSSGFTIYGPGDPTNPSSCIFTSAPAGGLLITFYRVLPLTQANRFTPGQALDGSLIEESLDKLTLIAQQLQDEINRAAVSDPSSPPGTSQPSLPPPIANYYLQWDPTGTFLVSSPGPTFTQIGNSLAPYRIVYDTNDPVSGGYAPSHYSGQSGTTWNVGDRCMNSGPAAGGYEGWVCTVQGSSSTAVFKPFGQVST